MTRYSYQKCTPLWWPEHKALIAWAQQSPRIWISASSPWHFVYCAREKDEAVLSSQAGSFRELGAIGAEMRLRCQSPPPDAPLRQIAPELRQTSVVGWLKRKATNRRIETERWRSQRIQADARLTSSRCLYTAGCELWTVNRKKSWLFDKVCLLKKFEFLVLSNYQKHSLQGLQKNEARPLN